MRILSVLSFLFLIFALRAYAVPPVLNYAGQVTVNGEAFDGNGLFKFALVNVAGTTTYWSNDGTSVGASEPQGSIQVPVNGGLYSILLGNTAIHGMSALDPSIFQQYSDAKLRVWFSDGVNGFQQLSPDRTFASVPYAFSAGSATIAQGSIEHSMLSNALRSDLNSSIKNITRDMLPDSVLSDLNRTITRDMLPPSVLADLNRTITKSNLGSDVLNDLNSSISLNRLSPEVLAALQVTPSISTQPFARYDWRTDSATIEARGHGHNLSYQWLKNGQVISGANAPVLELAKPTLDDNATYSVQLTNSVGQTTSQTITLRQAIGAPGKPIEEANSTQVPRNGLVLWLDANDLNADGLADNLPTGTLIDSWESKVGDANATQSSAVLKPKSNFFGDTNLKAVAFDGGDYLLDDNASLSVQHIFAIYRGKYQNNDILLSDNVFGLVQISEHNSRRHFRNGEFHRNTGGTVRVSGRSQGAEDFVSWQKDLMVMTAGAGGYYTGTFAKLGIGAKTANSSNWEGEFGEILFYNRTLSNSERDAVEHYLMVKWKITSNPERSANAQEVYLAALPQDELENGLIAYYKFEPISVEPNKVWDYSGNEKHLTMSSYDGNPWVDGVDGKALSFNGTSKAERSDSIIEASTIAMWLNPDLPITGKNEPNRVFKGSNGSHHRYFTLNSPLVGTSGHFNYSYGTTKWTGSKEGFNSFLKGWLHLCLSYDVNQNEFNIFLNSEKIEAYSTDSKTGRFFYSNKFSIGDSNFRGKIDEFRMYSRSLTPAEIEGLYLQVNSPILRMAPEHNATVGANFSLSLAADNGPTTYLAEGLPTGLSLNVSTGQITGTVSQPGYHRVFVKAMNEHGTGSSTIAIVVRPQTDQNGWPVDIPDGSDIPQNGMVLWLDANDVDADDEFDSGTDHLKLANWADKAGKDHNATQATAFRQPTIRADQLPARPGLNFLRFEGNQSLAFPTLNHGRTFFWVINLGAGCPHAAAFIARSGSNTWGDLNSKRPFVNASGYVQNGLHHINGQVVQFGNSGPYNSFLSQLQVLTLRTTDFQPADLIGKRGNVESYFTGNIGEILVYDRALLISEIETVEKYLGQKWGIALAGQEVVPDLTTGLIAHLPFDETTGVVANDVSGNGFNAALVGYDGNATWVPGKIGGALHFGNNDSGTLVRPVDDVFTVSLWLKTTVSGNSNSWYAQVGILGGPEQNYGFLLSGGHVTFKAGSNSKDFTTTANVNTGSWMHFAASLHKATKTRKLYINGSLDAQKAEWHDAETSPSAIGAWQIGHTGFSWEELGNGTLDDLRIYDRVLSNTEIQALYDLGSNPLASTTYASPNPSFTLTPAAGSVTTAHLTEQILKYLKPEITTQPQGATVPANGSATLSAGAEGKFLTFQWQKDGTDLVGETNATLVFSDFNGTQDDGNYTITISNDFGSVISAPAEVKEQ